GNAICRYAVISQNGRYVAFSGIASNLVPNDTNGYEDVFVHDLQTHQTTRVSVGSRGEQAGFVSWQPAISADGRYVAFTSGANNLVEHDVNVGIDVFVHDRWTGITRLVSVNSQGVQGMGDSYGAAISADGRFVSFSSEAANLAPGNTGPNNPGIFIHDQVT